MTSTTGNPNTATPSNGVWRQLTNNAGDDGAGVNADAQLHLAGRVVLHREGAHRTHEVQRHVRDTGRVLDTVPRRQTWSQCKVYMEWKLNGSPPPQ